MEQAQAQMKQVSERNAMMNVFRIYFQYMFIEIRDDEQLVTIAEFQKLRSVCRESAAMCRAIAKSFYLDRFNLHMSKYATDFWKVAHKYFENDKILRFQFHDGVPFSDVIIYSKHSREDLDFAEDFIDENTPSYVHTLSLITRVSGLSKKICIKTRKSSCKPIYGIFRVGLMQDPQINALTEQEYNLALEMIYQYRRSITCIDILYLRSFPECEPFADAKRMLNSYRFNTVDYSRFMRMNSLYKYFNKGKPKAFRP